MFHATLIIMSRKYFFGFQGPQLPFDKRFWTRGFPLEIRSRKAGLPFATRARKRELCLQSYLSRINRTEKSKIFKLFLETTSVFVSCYPDHNEPKIMFWFSKSGLEGSPNVRQCPLMTQKTRPLSHRIQKRTGHRRKLADKHYENFSHKILDSRVPLCYAISEGRPPLATQVCQCPSESANVRPSPPMSFRVRQCPLMSQKTRPLSHRIQKGQDLGEHRRT